ncbi:MAG: hypothetical protein JWO19_4894 [Bryobacterales bacterium]|nr:hypothetical protein [Bryobacterales bacterium]
MSDEQHGPRVVPFTVTEIRPDGSVAAVHFPESIYRVRERSELLCRKLADRAEVDSDQVGAQLWERLASRFSSESISDHYNDLRADRPNHNSKWALAGGCSNPARERFETAAVRAGYKLGATSDEDALALWLDRLAAEVGAREMIMVQLDASSAPAPSAVQSHERILTPMPAPGSPEWSSPQFQAKRRQAIRDYRSEGKAAGIRITAKMIAMAADKNWNDRTPVEKWIVGKDPRYCTIAVDSKIRKVLIEKPHLPKPSSK